jgi:hypothetical protein
MGTDYFSGNMHQKIYIMLNVCIALKDVTARPLAFLKTKGKVFEGRRPVLRTTLCPIKS